MVNWALKVQCFFETADSTAKVAKFNINFCFLNIYFWYSLIIKKDFVKFDKCLF